MKQKKSHIVQFLLLCILVAGGSSLSYAEAKLTGYWHQRASLFEILPSSSQDIIFLGDSITNGAEWGELFNNPHVKNRGIVADTSFGVLVRLNTIIAGKPDMIFLMIGINDLSRAENPMHVSLNVEKIIQKVQEHCPNTKFYLQSVLPVYAINNPYRRHRNLSSKILELNALLKETAKKNNIEYIDLHAAFAEKESNLLKKEFSNDGLHLTGKGYLLWKTLIQSKIK